MKSIILKSIDVKYLATFVASLMLVLASAAVYADDCCVDTALPCCRIHALCCE